MFISHDGKQGLVGPGVGQVVSIHAFYSDGLISNPTKVYRQILFCNFFLKLGQPRPLFVYFRSFQQQFYRKIVDFSGNRTRIVGVEGEHADH